MDYALPKMIRDFRDSLVEKGLL